ncbi:MAG: hypothetical protein LBP83_07515 [Dysgonamonadaceae bacterium]|nr:hypothetical protein [Dysgonamonadaceae bacterium]
MIKKTPKNMKITTRLLINSFTHQLVYSLTHSRLFRHKIYTKVKIP